MRFSKKGSRILVAVMYAPSSCDRYFTGLSIFVIIGYFVLRPKIVKVNL